MPAFDLAPMVRQAEVDRRQRGQLGGRLHYATEGRDVLYNSPDGWEVEQPWLWWGQGGDGDGGPWPGALGSPIPGAGGGSGTCPPCPLFHVAQASSVTPWPGCRGP